MKFSCFSEASGRELRGASSSGPSGGAASSLASGHAEAELDYADYLAQATVPEAAGLQLYSYTLLVLAATLLPQRLFRPAMALVVLTCAAGMGARVAQVFAHADVVGEIVFRAVGVLDVARVADGAFKHLARVEHGIHGDAHVLDPVQRVKDAEDVDAGFGGLPHELLHHVVRVIGVAHAIRSAQEHLGQEVGHARAQVAQALPGAFLQEAVGDVECGTAPAFDREQFGQVRRIGGRDLDHVVGAHPRRQ